MGVSEAEFQFGAQCWEVWGSPLCSVCPCLSKAELLNSDFSFCLAPPFLLFPLPLLPCPSISELEGEAGGDSEEGKKGFSFSVSLFLMQPHCWDCHSEQAQVSVPAAFPLLCLRGVGA